MLTWCLKTLIYELSAHIVHTKFMYGPLQQKKDCTYVHLTIFCSDLCDASLGDSSSDGNSPTNPTPPTIFIDNNNPSPYMNDYRPSARGNHAGMSYMFVSKDDPNYNMNHRRRGKAVIFNFAQWVCNLLALFVSCEINMVF